MFPGAVPFCYVACSGGFCVLTSVPSKTTHLPVCLSVVVKHLVNARYRDSVDNTVEENSSVFSLICWLPSARACGQ